MVLPTFLGMVWVGLVFFFGGGGRGEGQKLVGLGFWFLLKGRGLVQQLLV